MSSARAEERMVLSMKKPPPPPQQRLDKFSPKGLRVLLVDDNPLCLATMERMLQQCHYNVTICARVSQAIYLLTENRGAFDIIMSEVCLPEEGAFKLLEIAEMGLDLPVILMSVKGETSVVMQGITHGACDYLIKPIRTEELRNIWQHVVRRRNPHQHQRCNFNTYVWDDMSLGGESSNGGREIDSPECCSKKRKYKAAAVEEEDTGQQIEDISDLKRARVHWTVQLHHQFVKSVNHLQIDKAVPKKILEIMKVQGLTRENVASHLQKYRLYLRRMSGIITEPLPVTSFQAAGDGEAGGSMNIRPEGCNPQQCLSPPAALNLSGRIDKATQISLQQYRTFEQKRAVENEAHSHSKDGLGIDPCFGLSLKTPKKNWSAAGARRFIVTGNNTAVKSEHVVDTARMAGLVTTKSQSPSPSSFTGSTGKTTVDGQEEKEAEILSTWNDAENLFVEKFVHDCELLNLSAAAPAQDFLSTVSPADISDYLLDDLLAQPK